ncbi:MAG: hypothetical protein HY673_20690 [Chloroflexi bacterium]|nr:hypothetical protein [Chloroflexota bacterium]
MDVKILAEANLLAQILLGVLLITGAFLAKIKKNLRSHCLLMRIGVVVQILAIAFVMAPATIGYIRHEPRDGLFNVQMLIHSVFGLGMVGFWVYINLMFEGVLKSQGRLRPAMRIAFASWGISLLLGLSLYAQIWT